MMTAVSHFTTARASQWRLVSVRTGKVRHLGSADAADPMDRAWTSAFAKEPVIGSATIDSQGLAGDEQADRRYHGGPEKAVLVYANAHYPLWRAEWPAVEFGPGGWGENLTIEGMSEDHVCVGDTYACGELRLQVSQPRQPCWKIDRRWQTKGLTAATLKTGRTGWYCRVVRPGNVRAGDVLILDTRPHPELTIRHVSEVTNRRKTDPAAAAKLLDYPLLSHEWRDDLAGLR